jgi:hypothetical protein
VENGRSSRFFHLDSIDLSRHVPGRTAVWQATALSPFASDDGSGSGAASQITGHLDEAILAAPTLRVIANLAGRRFDAHARAPSVLDGHTCGVLAVQP